MAEPELHGALVILVVEDEFLVRQAIAEHLREAGCVVLEAGTGEQALAICESRTAVDVLFTDVHLNGAASGWEVAEKFRAARNDIPVVYASGNRHDHARCVPDSVWVDKPYRPGEILRTCRRLKTRLETRDALHP
jgi:CheY-like chemotaxis protein